MPRSTSSAVTTRSFQVVSKAAAQAAVDRSPPTPPLLLAREVVVFL
jgi:hypothetical protein